MPTDEMFDSAVRTSGDRAGVFEYDGETGYFYLYETNGKGSQKVLGAIQIMTGAPDFTEQDVAILWNSAEHAVALFIRKQLWAAFNLQTGAKHGGTFDGFRLLVRLIGASP